MGQVIRDDPRMQRNFEPMRKQVEAWQRCELTDVTAKVVIYEAFVEGRVEAPKHLSFVKMPSDLKPFAISNIRKALNNALGTRVIGMSQCNTDPKA